MKPKVPPARGLLSVPERIIGFTRLPYALGCLIIAVVAGGPGSFLMFYLSGFGVKDAWDKTVSVSILSVLSATPQVPAVEGAVLIALSTFALFADLYLVRYLRHQVLMAEPTLSRLTPGGETAYRRAFSVVANPNGFLLFTLIFFVMYFPARALIAGGTTPLLGLIILTLIADAVYGAAFWSYLSGLWGVYRFGHEPLNLRPFYEDSMLGLRPLGHIVVTYAMTFSFAITMTLGGSIITGTTSTIATNLVIVALGVVMLFVPLRCTHRKMVQVKEEEEASLRSRIRVLLVTAKNPDPGNQQALSQIEELVEIQRFQALRAETSRIPDWPFEIRTVEQLVGILLGVVMVLLARLLELVG